MASTSMSLPNSTGENIIEQIGGETELKTVLKNVFDDDIFDLVLVTNSEDWSSHIGSCIFQLNQAVATTFKRHNIFFICD